MGLLGRTWWKKHLKELFPECWHNDIEDKSSIKLYMEDMMITAHNIINMSNSLDDVKSKWCNIIENRLNRFPNVDTFIAMFDVEENVPLSKGPEREARKKNRFTYNDIDQLGNNAFLCFKHHDSSDPIYAKLFREEANLKHTVPYHVYLQKHISTEAFRRDMVQYATRCLNSTQSIANVINKTTIYIDGGVRNMDDIFEEYVEDLTLESTKNREYMIKHDRTGVNMISPCEVHNHVPGESDLKIIRNILEHLGKDMWITCCDTDCIPILLLWMHKFIDPKTKKFPNRIYLDLFSKYSIRYVHDGIKTQKQRYTIQNTNEVLDVTMLWRSIIKWMKQHHKSTKNPIEVFCLLMVLGGTDYVDKPIDITHQKIWETFVNGGSEILAQAISINTDPDSKKCDYQLRLCEFSTNNICVNISEKDIADFIKLMYCVKKAIDYTRHFLPGKPNGSSSSVESVHGYKLPSFNTINNAYSVKRKRNAPEGFIISEDRVNAIIRRVSWNMFYWCAGPLFPVINVIERDADSKSLYGWEIDPVNDKVIISQAVTSTCNLNKRRKLNK